MVGAIRDHSHSSGRSEPVGAAGFRTSQGWDLYGSGVGGSTTTGSPTTPGTTTGSVPGTGNPTTTQPPGNQPA